MKTLGSIILLLLSTLSWGQTYQSSHTVHLPLDIWENIQRTITLAEEYVHIKSFVEKTNVDNQVWKIYKSWEENETNVYHLISLNETHSIRFYIRQVNPHYIEVHQPTLENRIPKLHLYLEINQ